MDEVLQTTTVFSNVSKGILAKREDLIEAFGTTDETAICKKILAEGELQVSDKERKVELDTLFRDVASVLGEKCINPETNRPYTVSMLERALRDVHFSVDPKRPAKAQAIESLPLLQQRFPIERARMRLQLTVPLNNKDEVHEVLTANQSLVEEKDLVGSMLVVVCLVDPGAFRALHALVQGLGGGSRVEVVALAAINEDTDVDADIQSLNIGGSNAVNHRNGGPGLLDAAAPSHGAGILVGSASAMRTSVTVSLGSSGYIPAAQASHTVPRRMPQNSQQHSNDAVVIHPKGPISSLPEEHASRRERFAELDTLQDGWKVELRGRGEGAPVEAVFYSPEGERVGAYAVARRMALQASKR